MFEFDELKNFIATNLCEKYPTTSNKGMKYIFLLYDYNSNSIHAKAMKNNKGPTIIKAYEEVYNELSEAGITPVLQYLDNELSKDLIQCIKDKELKFQLAAPHDHQLNPAERAVQTFKNHFISILQGCDHRFPKYLWCQLLPQSVLTFNLLRKSRINPNLSAHEQVFGSFNYQQTPLRSLGTLVIIHKANRPSWAAHRKEGVLVDRAKDHYQSYKVSMKNTSGTRTSDAIKFLPTKYNMPKTSSQDRIVAALEEIAEAITNPKY